MQSQSILGVCAMNRVNLFFVINIAGLFFVALGMDEKPKRDDDGSGKRGSTALTRRDSKEDIRIDMEDPNRKREQPVTPLDLRGVKAQQIKGTASTSREGKPKTPVSNLKGLKEQVERSKSTHRELQQKTRGLKRSQALERPTFHKKEILTTSVDVPMDSIPQGRPGNIDETTSFRLEDFFGIKTFDGEKYYSEEEVWEKIAILNPILYMIAEKDNMPLDKLMEFAAVVQDLDIGHQVFMQIAHGNLGDDDGKITLSRWEKGRNFLIGNPKAETLSTSFLHSEYEKIKKNMPDKYKELAYEAVKAAYDLSEGRHIRSTIADTHIELQNGKINEQDATIRQQWFGIGLGAVGTIVGWILTIYQFVQACEVPGNSTA
jgi:hypothetical protein